MHQPPTRQANRRAVLAVLLGLGVALPARAQPAATSRTGRVGFVSWFPPDEAGQVDPLREGLRELGWQERRNLELEVHFAQGSADRTRAALQSLLQRRWTWAGNAERVVEIADRLVAAGRA